MVYREAGIDRKNSKRKQMNTFNKMSTKLCAADIGILKQERDRKQRLKQLLEILEFDTKSMKDIHSNFSLMDDSRQREIGLIDFAEFCTCTKLEINEYSQELFCLFQDNDNNKYIDYRFFLISIVSMLSPSLDSKIKFTFNIFDIDGNGIIDKDELSSVIAATQLLKGKQLIQRVEKIMSLADVDGNQQLDYDEFAVCCRRYQSLLFPKL